MQERFLEGRTSQSARGLPRPAPHLAVHGLATREQADAAVRAMREVGLPDARFFDADMRKPAAINAMMDAVAAFRTADYWLIPARAANQSFEPLDRAPPRGIHHHFARLALLTPPRGLRDLRVQKEKNDDDDE